MHIWSALRHATDQRKVATCGPQLGPWRQILISAIDQEDPGRRYCVVHVSDRRIRQLIQPAGECRKSVEGDRVRNTHSLHPTPHRAARNAEYCRAFRLS
jgi:hypothetical protein